MDVLAWWWWKGNRATVGCVDGAVRGLSLDLLCISYFLNFKEFHMWVTQRVKLTAFPCYKSNKNYFGHPDKILTG